MKFPDVVCNQNGRKHAFKLIIVSSREKYITHYE